MDKIIEHLLGRGSVRMTSMSVDEKVALITKNLQEILGEDRLRAVLKERDANVYWGTAATGRPHIGYFVPMVKLADFLRAGCHVTVLIADLHAYLDNMKAPWQLLHHRAAYYEQIIKGMLTSIGVPIDKLRFVLGSTFQLKQDYILEVFRLSCMTTQHDAKKAGAEVVKQVESPLLSSLLYPGMQALDEHFLGCDAQFGGVDQRKIFTFAEKYMPALGYKKAVHLMNPMVPGLQGSKMSSSEADSKIDILGDSKTVIKKLRQAFCEEGNIEQNGILSFIKYVIFPVLELKALNSGEALMFRIDRPEQHGGNLSFSDYQSLEESFASKAIHPLDLKAATSQYINMLLEPIRKGFEASPEKMETLKKAYPDDFLVKQVSKIQIEEKPVDISSFDIRVGRVLEVSKHPDADSLFVEKVDLGEETGPRAIVSGLVKYMPAEAIQGKLVAVLTNLKPATMRGITSNGMLLCASSETTVELLTVPEGAKPGERIVPEGSDASSAAPSFVIDGKKKDAALMTSILADLKTNSNAVASFKDVPLVASSGVLSATSLQNANIS